MRDLALTHGYERKVSDDLVMTGVQRSVFGGVTRRQVLQLQDFMNMDTPILHKRKQQSEIHTLHSNQLVIRVSGLHRGAQSVQGTVVVRGGRLHLSCVAIPSPFVEEALCIMLKVNGFLQSNPSSCLRRFDFQGSLVLLVQRYWAPTYEELPA